LYSIGIGGYQPTEIDHRLTKNIFDLADAIAGPLENPVGDANEIPHSVDGRGSVLRRQGGADRRSDVVQFLDKRFALVPVNKGAGPADGLDAFAEFSGKLARSFGARQQHAQFLKQDRVILGMLDQGRSQRRCSESHKSFRGDRFSSGHDSSYFWIYVGKICESGDLPSAKKSVRLMGGSSRAAFVF